MSVLVATLDPNRPRLVPFVAAIILCLPTFIAALPVLFVAVSVAWNVTGADHGGTHWPVTATYVVVFLAIAVANSWVVGRLARRHRRVPAPGPASRGARHGTETVGPRGGSQTKDRFVS